SRRRHTRFSRDWSSDVCSSDLVFFMRVAMGLALNEVNREARAIEFYETLSSFDFMSSTPTLFNSGTLHSQLSSCYLTTVSDDLRSEERRVGKECGCRWRPRTDT